MKYASLFYFGALAFLLIACGGGGGSGGDAPPPSTPPTPVDFAPKVYGLMQAGAGASAASAVRINWNSGADDTISLGSTSCNGAYEPLYQRTLLSCALGLIFQPYSMVDEATGVLSKGLNIAPVSTAWTPVACETKTSPRAGTCYYGFGGYQIVNGSTVAKARIVVADKGGVNPAASVDLPDVVNGRFPAFLFVSNDEVLAVTGAPDGSAGGVDVVYRMNGTTRALGQTMSLDMRAIGAAVSNGRLYVSGYIEPTPARLTYVLRVFDVASGAKVRDSVLPGGAAGVASDGTNVYVVSPSIGISSIVAYEVATMQQVASVDLSSPTTVLSSIAAFRGSLWVGDASGGIFKFNAQTLQPIARWDAPNLQFGNIIVAAP